MDFDSMTRAEIVEYLESWGYACLEEESTEGLRHAAKLNHEYEEGNPDE